MTQISIKVIVDSAHQSETEAVCASLTKIGMKVETTMPDIGVIFGSAEESLLPQVSAIVGVQSAQPEGQTILPPPSGKVPQ